MATIEDALELALRSHRGKTDKGGKPYILHPLRVMARVNGEVAMMAAVLHDVVEDDPNITLGTLRQLGFDEEVIAVVDCLTRRDGESYEAFIERTATNPVARRVKLADLEDNMDIRRIAALTPKDSERLLRYQRAWQRLQKAD